MQTSCSALPLNPKIALRNRELLQYYLIGPQPSSVKMVLFRWLPVKLTPFPILPFLVSLKGLRRGRRGWERLKNVNIGLINYLVQTYIRKTAIQFNEKHQKFKSDDIFFHCYTIFTVGPMLIVKFILICVYLK